MTKPDKNNPFGPESSVPPASKSEGAHSSPRATPPVQPLSPERPKKRSRLDAEIERLRQSPTPTQSNGRSNEEENFFNGVAFMGIFSRTRDIIAANFNDMLDKADDPAKMVQGSAKRCDDRHQKFLQFGFGPGPPGCPSV